MAFLFPVTAMESKTKKKNWKHEEDEGIVVVPGENSLWIFSRMGIDRSYLKWASLRKTAFIYNMYCRVLCLRIIIIIDIVIIIMIIIIVMQPQVPFLWGSCSFEPALHAGAGQGGLI